MNSNRRRFSIRRVLALLAVLILLPGIGFLAYTTHSEQQVLRTNYFKLRDVEVRRLIALASTSDSLEQFTNRVNRSFFSIAETNNIVVCEHSGRGETVKIVIILRIP